MTEKSIYAKKLHKSLQIVLKIIIIQSTGNKFVRDSLLKYIKEG